MPSATTTSRRSPARETARLECPWCGPHGRLQFCVDPNDPEESTITCGMCANEMSFFMIRQLAQLLDHFEQQQKAS